MKRLSKENIQFIENYLENSDVYYADIRMEMTDHVASAIEKRMHSQQNNDFYTVFKDYMLEHKAQLLESNKTFLKHVDKSILKRLLKQLLKPKTLVFFILLTIAGQQLIPSIGRQQLLTVGSWFPIFSIVPFLIIYIGARKFYNISRFSGIERLAFFYMILFQILNLSRIVFKAQLESDSTNYWIIVFMVATIITVTVTLLQLTFIIISDYRKQYKNLT